jgi:hypothetical protein
MNIAAIGSADAVSYRPQSSTTSGTSTTSFSLSGIETPALTSSLAPVSATTLPAVQMTADQLAMAQDGIQPPDPTKTAAEMNTRASALITDTQTGEVLGGVWPGVANVSAVDIGDDSRLSSGSSTEQAEALAQDIEKTTGKSVTIHYFQPDDTSAPTFGSNVLGS